MKGKEKDGGAISDPNLKGKYKRSFKRGMLLKKLPNTWGLSDIDDVYTSEEESSDPDAHHKGNCLRGHQRT